MLYQKFARVSLRNIPNWTQGRPLLVGRSCWSSDLDFMSGLPTELAFELSGHQGPVRAVRLNGEIMVKSLRLPGCFSKRSVLFILIKAHQHCIQETATIASHAAAIRLWGCGTLTRGSGSKPIQAMAPKSWMQMRKLASSPGPFVGGKGPGVYCLRMRQNIRYITRKIIVYNMQTRL